MPGNISINEVSGKEFDFIIVGMCDVTAGLRLAEKLSRETQLSVLVLDAGDISLGDSQILMPAKYGSHFGQEQYDWNFRTTPQKYSNNVRYPWPRGNVLGGSSAINFYLWTKPPKADIDDWEQLGNPGWNWKSFQKHVQEIEGYQQPAAKSSAAHGLNFRDWDIGTEGPIKLYHPATISRPELMAHETLQRLNVPKARAPVSGDPKGAYFTPKTIDHQGYIRSYATTAFYLPYIDRTNFKVLACANVTRLITSGIDMLTANAVEFTHKGATHTVYVSKEVVLCAGALRSPQVLELSGIGRRDVLEAIGVPPKLDLPGVGENLQEHMYCGMSFELNDDVEDLTLDVLRDSDSLKEHMELYKTKEGAFMLGPTALAFTPLRAVSTRAEEIYEKARKKIDDEWDKYPEGLRQQYKIQLERLDSDSPACELIAFPGFLSAPNPPEPGKKYITLACALNHNFSRGTTHSVSSDPRDHPAFDPHYFEHDIDLQTFVELAKFVRRWSHTKPLATLIKKEVNPGNDCMEDPQLADWIKSTFSSTFHTAGTLTMVPKERGGVVDSNLMVYGTTNIRVADLSIVPLHIAAHTLSVAYAIGAQG
ncbi:alcohol oxidase [Coniophora puteana RWD-64-598 SS2]|uniref:Alcohol oxidase n=1 Tax=Coniophora puteana (strain RWD-64-598) TaxID=741705 RepID=A0A5M3MMU9_CONPW|nr:alcohol oxidase [Coniophora puteana RWD-64-598 SS2]EIW80025.1 alcohol oxidase [Coniophora puteana RWD-64-598 SS2]